MPTQSAKGLGGPEFIVGKPQEQITRWKGVNICIIFNFNDLLVNRFDCLQNWNYGCCFLGLAEASRVSVSTHLSTFDFDYLFNMKPIDFTTKFKLEEDKTLLRITDPNIYQFIFVYDTVGIHIRIGTGVSSTEFHKNWIVYLIYRII